MQKTVNLTGKKIAAIALSAVLLVGGSVAGTMAYLQSQTQTVTNTFTIGQVNITLDEAKTDAYGAKQGETRTTTGNEYKLIPGHEYQKDPTVYVSADSEDCYLFVKVVNGIATIEGGEATIAKQMEQNGWVLVKDGVYVYADAEDKPAVVSAGANKVVFETFAIAEGYKAEGLAFAKSAVIEVTAYAVQADGFVDKTAAEIWSAAFGA